MLAEWIVSAFPKQGATYCEPFAGRGNVFFRAAESEGFERWRLNDMQTAPFLRALRDTRERVSAPEITEESFRAHKEGFANGNPLSALWEPLLTFSGGGYANAGPNIASRYPGKVATGKGYSDRVFRAGEILRRTGAEITQDDWRQSLAGLGREDFVYLDPPYDGASVRAYNGKSVDIGELVSTLLEADFLWVLSEYENRHTVRLGRPFAIKARRVTTGQQRVAGNGRMECLWRNF